MKYIVYLEGKGYFVGYQDKLNNKYSDNYHDAQQYNTIAGAMNRLGINTLVYSLETFLNKNCDLSTIRNFKLNGVLDVNNDDISFSNGRIEIVENGKFIGNGNKLVLDYLLSRPFKLKSPSVFVDKADMDFWNEYLKS